MEPIYTSESKLLMFCWVKKKLKVNYRIRKSRNSTVNEYIDSRKTAAIGFLLFFKKRKA